jgi:hypothetical protein
MVWGAVEIVGSRRFAATAAIVKNFVHIFAEI